MPRNGSAAIEIGRGGVRGVSLGGSARQPRLNAWADRRVDDHREIEAAVRDVAEQLDPRIPLRLLLSGEDARIERVDLPKGRRRSLGRAAIAQLFADDPAEAEQYLIGVRPEGVRLGLRRRVAVLLVRREPLETWCGLLAALGRPVSALVSPGALALAQAQGRPGGTLWVDLTGARTALTLLRDGRLVEERSFDKPPESDDEPIATVEARLQDVRAIDQMLRDRAGSGGNLPVDRVVICGASSVAEPLHHQLREPYEKLGLELELQDPWRGVAFGQSPPPPRSAAHLSGCLRLARAGRLPLSAVPRRTARSRRTERIWAAAASLSLTALVGSTAWMLALEQRHDELLAARERTTMALASARERSAAVQDGPSAARQAATNWSPLLTDVGHLAQPGIDYRRLVLAPENGGARIAIAGTASGDGVESTGQLMRRLANQLGRSPYAASPPGLAVSSSDDSPMPLELRFAAEEVVSGPPASDEGDGR